MLVLSNNRCVYREWSIPCNPSGNQSPLWHHKPLWFTWAWRNDGWVHGFGKVGLLLRVFQSTCVISYHAAHLCWVKTEMCCKIRFCKDMHSPWVISKHAELIGKILIKDFEGGLITIHYTVNCPQAIVKKCRSFRAHYFMIHFAMLWKTDSKSNYIYYRSDHKIFIGFSNIPPFVIWIHMDCTFLSIGKKAWNKIYDIFLPYPQYSLKITRSNCFPLFPQVHEKQYVFWNQSQSCDDWKQQRIMKSVSNGHILKKNLKKYHSDEIY